MTIHDPRRTDPIVAHAYTVPLVREVPARPPGHAASDPHQLGPRLSDAADPHAW